MNIESMTKKKKTTYEAFEELGNAFEALGNEIVKEWRRSWKWYLGIYVIIIGVCYFAGVR